MVSFNDVIEELNKLAHQYDVNYSGVEIKVNKRLTSTLGRVVSHFMGGRYHPVKIEFSQKLLNTHDYADVMDVVRHEFAHFYLTETTGEKHGHDEAFKRICEELGCDGHRAKTIHEEKKSYKYSIKCAACGSTNIDGFSRMCRTLKFIGLCGCPHCNEIGFLEVTQNW